MTCRSSSSIGILVSAAAVLLILSAGYCSAQPITIEQRYLSLTEDELSSISNALVDLSEAYSVMFGVRKPYPITLIMFGDFSRYKDFQLKEDDYPGGTDYGYYYDAKKHAVIVWDPARADRDEAFKTTVHEICHLINRRLFPSLSLWANEGLAVFFERMKFGGVVVFDPRSSEVTFNNLSLRAGDRQLPHITNFMGQKESRLLFQNSGYEPYRLSWSLVFFFLVDPARAKIFTSMLTRMGMEPDTALADRYYPGGVAQLDDDWNAFLRENRFGCEWALNDDASRARYRPDARAVERILSMITWYEYATNAADLMHAKKFAAALPVFDKAIAISADSSSVWFNKGYSHQLLKQHGAAVKAYTEANRIDAGNFWSWNNLAIAQTVIGRTNDAIASYRKAAAIDPERADCWLYAAGLYEGTRRYGDALEHYARSISVSNENPLAWFGKGRVLAALGKTNEARDACDKALERRCDDPHVYYLLAELTSTPGQIAEMLDYLSEAIKRDRAFAKRAAADPAFTSVRGHAAFQALVNRR
ncbi:MAG: tetratricopeptide repeat protein [Spirochaetota bacterium]